MAASRLSTSTSSARRWAWTPETPHCLRVAISNPCFELWLILHHAEHSRWITNQEAHSIRREHDGSTDKQLDSSKYMHLRDAAVRRARQLTELHVDVERMLPHDNPSSGVYRLVEAIEED